MLQASSWLGLERSPYFNLRHYPAQVPGELEGLPSCTLVCQQVPPQITRSPKLPTAIACLPASVHCGDCPGGLSRRVEGTRNLLLRLSYRVGGVIVAIGFVAVTGLVIYQAVRSARDPEYRAALEAQSAAARTRSSSIGMSSAMGARYHPSSDPG
jgi:hypothetical protein